MTLRTGVRKIQLGMIRVVGTCIIGVVTRPAVRRRAIELAIVVTLRTGCRNVSTGQWEVRVIVIERRRSPGERGVALGAGMIVIARDVIGVVHLLKITLVAVKAGGRCAFKLSIRMTGGTVRLDVRSGERETGIIMTE